MVTSHLTITMATYNPPLPPSGMLVSVPAAPRVRRPSWQCCWPSGSPDTRHTTSHTTHSTPHCTAPTHIRQPFSLVKQHSVSSSQALSCWLVPETAAHTKTRNDRSYLCVCVCVCVRACVCACLPASACMQNPACVRMYVCMCVHLTLIVASAALPHPLLASATPTLV